VCWSRQAERALGREVVIGLVETHGRSETGEEAQGFEILPRKKLAYQGATLEEFDLDAALARRPRLILVDELAHTNAPGSRHPKRYQDILELLRAGIDVFTTLNVQHVESRADSVAGITGIPMRETVPDSIIDEASEVQLIDLSPEKLLERLKEGRVYLGERKDVALQHFFKPEHLTALRELALRVTADRVDRDLLLLRKSVGQQATWSTADRLLVAIGPNPQGENLIRAARRSAAQIGANWFVVYVKDGSRLSADEEKFLERNLSLARELGAEVVVRDDPDRVEGLIRTARERNATRIILGKPEGSFAFSMRSRWLEHLFKRVGGVEITFVPTNSVMKPPILVSDRSGWMAPKGDYWHALLIVTASVPIGIVMQPWLGYYAVGLVLLSIVLGTGLFLSPMAVIALSIMQATAWNFFFIEP
jgi:two-component system sensor histidine kinase KdpD